MATRTKGKTAHTNGAAPKLRLKIEMSRVDWGLLEDIQDIEEQLAAQTGTPNFRKMRSILAHFVVDKDENFVDEMQASALIRSLKFEEIIPTFEKFMSGFQAVQLPPANSSG